MGIDSTPAAPVMSFTEGSFKMDLQRLFAMEGIFISLCALNSDHTLEARPLKFIRESI